MTGIPIRRAVTAALFVSASALAGCATTSARPPVIALDDPPPAIVATPAAEPARAVEIVTIPEPLPLPDCVEFSAFMLADFFAVLVDNCAWLRFDKFRKKFLDPNLADEANTD